jgi:GNAT superfamily N-acetyltransferase
MSPRDHHAPWTRTVVTHAAQPRGQKVGREPTFSIADAGSAEARWALQQYFDELAGCFDGGFVVGDAFDEAAALYSEPTGRFLLASLEEEIVGCGAVVFLDADTAEIKRMWVSPTSRGVGLGSQLLDRLEHELRLAGRRSVVLDTNEALIEAIAMYEAAGYRPIARYNDNPYVHHWFTKSLT